MWQFFETVYEETNNWMMTTENPGRKVIKDDKFAHNFRQSNFSVMPQPFSENYFFLFHRAFAAAGRKTLPFFQVPSDNKHKFSYILIKKHIALCSFYNNLV